MAKSSVSRLGHWAQTVFWLLTYSFSLLFQPAHFGWYLYSNHIFIFIPLLKNLISPFLLLPPDRPKQVLSQGALQATECPFSWELQVIICLFKGSCLLICRHHPWLKQIRAHFHTLGTPLYDTLLASLKSFRFLILKECSRYGPWLPSLDTPF